jgi:hypothetical protein
VTTRSSMVMTVRMAPSKSKRAITLLDDGPLRIGDCSIGLHHPVAVRLSLIVQAAAVGFETTGDRTGRVAGMTADVASERHRAATWAIRLVDIRNIGPQMLAQGARQAPIAGRTSGFGIAGRARQP